MGTLTKKLEPKDVAFEWNSWNAIAKPPRSILVAVVDLKPVASHRCPVRVRMTTTWNALPLKLAAATSRKTEESLYNKNSKKVRRCEKLRARWIPRRYNWEVTLTPTSRVINPSL